MRFAVPEVIRLVRYDRIPHREVAFTRHNVFARDRYKCSYCGKRKSSDELDLDHVVPRSRDGANEWTNVVTSCRPCNLRKADRLPDEAGMPLKNRPVRPRCGRGTTTAPREHRSAIRACASNDSTIAASLGRALPPPGRVRRESR